MKMLLVPRRSVVACSPSNFLCDLVMILLQVVIQGDVGYDLPELLINKFKVS